jgi:2-polyprenyl-6-hydroxyphenyl methylase/3-demethylubiquinone-9 3-methyltransferase
MTSADSTEDRRRAVTHTSPGAVSEPAGKPQERTTNPVAPGPDPRFAFGANWCRFLRTLNEEQLAAARASLELLLGHEALRDRRFLDAGSGSGLFSLAAHQLGAHVLSFDLDPQSVACAEELRRRYAAPESTWDIRTGSLLDRAFLESLGEFDIVYAWGVAHHTGAMWQAIDLLSQRVVPGGRLWLAIYNDQGVVSHFWACIKRQYNCLPIWLRTPYVLAVGGPWSVWRVVCRLAATAAAMFTRLLVLRNPAGPARRIGGNLCQSQRGRGMRWWTDLVDWIGGWPFEVAKPEEVFVCLRDRGFELLELKTCGGRLGCNEFLFRRR